MRNSRLINFLPESRLPFLHLTNSNQLHLSKKRSGKAEINWYQGLLWKNGTRISVWNIPTGKTRLPFQTLRCSRRLIFPRKDPKSPVPFTFQPNFPETLCKWKTTYVWPNNSCKITFTRVSYYHDSLTIKCVQNHRLSLAQWLHRKPKLTLRSLINTPFLANFH